MFSIIWRFRIATEQEAAFAQHYADNGSWAELFGRHSAWRSTRLLRDADQAGVYLTVGQWDSAEAYARFRRRYADAYAELDRRCAALTIEETLLGHFVHAV